MLALGFRLGLNGSDSKQLWVGQNPRREFLPEVRLVETGRNSYLRMNLAEYESLISNIKNISIDSPFIISRILTVTRYANYGKEDTFCIERLLKPAAGLLEKITLTKGTVDHMVNIFSVVKITFENYSQKESQNIFEIFLIEIAQHFNLQAPSIDELRVWYTDRLFFMDETQESNKIYDLRGELLHNFEDFLIHSLNNYILKVKNTNRSY